MLTEEQAESLRQKTIAFVLAVRTDYLGSSGASVLRHWEILQDRMRAATRTTCTPAEWATAFARGLQLPALGATGAACLLNLCAAVPTGGARPWLDLVEREYGYIIAAARAEADRLREARKKDRRKSA